MTGRKSPLLIHPTTNGEDNLQDPQPTPDPGAAFLHRPWCPPRYALHDRRCRLATGASVRLLENAPRCCSVAPRLHRAGETRAWAAVKSTSGAGQATCACTGVRRTRRDRLAARLAPTARSALSRAAGTRNAGRRRRGAAFLRQRQRAQPPRDAGPARRGRGRRRRARPERGSRRAHRALDAVSIVPWDPDDASVVN